MKHYILFNQNQNQGEVLGRHEMYPSEMYQRNAQLRAEDSDMRWIIDSDEHSFLGTADNNN